MSCCLVVGEKVSDLCRRRLELLDFNVIVIRAFELLDSAVSSHPDMLFSFIGRDLIVSCGYYEFQKNTIDCIADIGQFNLMISDYVQKSPYPYDIAYNVLSINNCVIGNMKHVSPDIIKSAEAQSFNMISVKQGYTACSSAKISDKALITADTGIAEAAASSGCDVLLISAGNIKLDGYDYGFIGGASGLINGALYFSGNIEAHPDYDKIYSFCNKYGVEVISLSDEALHDCGGIVQIA